MFSARHGSSAESAVVEKFVGLIWDQSDVFTVHICSARAQIEPLKSSLLFPFWRDDFENVSNQS